MIVSLYSQRMKEEILILEIGEGCVCVCVCRRLFGTVQVFRG